MWSEGILASQLQGACHHMQHGAIILQGLLSCREQEPLHLLGNKVGLWDSGNDEMAQDCLIR